MSESTPDSPSAGALLRAAREKQGLHIAALAAAIKVTPRKLDALEHDRWDELPDATFTRALAQTVCRTLKIDARPVLDKLPAAGGLALEAQDAGLNEPFRERPGREQPGGLATSAMRPMVFAAALLMGAAVLVYVLPADLWGRLAALTAPSAVVTAPVATPASAPAAVASVASAAAGLGADAPASAPLAAAGTDGAVSAAGVPAAPASTTGETVFSAPPPPAPDATANAAQPVATAASGLVQLRTSESSWIEVRDASGTTLLSRTVLPGESVGLDGSLPIRMTIGNAAATQVGFKGQPVDLASRTRDNIARVELR